MTPDAFNRHLKRMRRDQASFKSVYEFYLPKLKHHLLAKFGRQVDFEDVSEELFVKLLGMDSPPEVENPNAWLYRIADNIALDILRKERRTDALGDGVAAPEAEEGEFFSVVNKLPPPDRELVTLVIWEGYSLKEAAGIIGAGYAATRQRYSRALKKLREILK